MPLVNALSPSDKSQYGLCRVLSKFILSRALDLPAPLEALPISCVKSREKESLTVSPKDLGSSACQCHGLLWVSSTQTKDLVEALDKAPEWRGLNVQRVKVNIYFSCCKSNVWRKLRKFLYLSLPEELKLWPECLGGGEVTAGFMDESAVSRLQASGSSKFLLLQRDFVEG